MSTQPRRSGGGSKRAQAGEAVAAFHARARPATSLAQVPGLFALRLEKHRAIDGAQRAEREQRRPRVVQAAAVRRRGQQVRDSATSASCRGVARRAVARRPPAIRPGARVAGMQLVLAAARVRVDEQQALVLARERAQHFEQQTCLWTSAKLPA